MALADVYRTPGVPTRPQLVFLCCVVLTFLLTCCGTHVQAAPAMVIDYCAINVAQEAQCPLGKPLCCSINSIVRCCPYDMTCETCMTNAVGYEVTRGGIFITLVGLTFLTLFGSVITTGIGRNTAWLFEQQRILSQLKQRAAMRRAEAREFKQELNQTEEPNLEENAACVVCCARRTDCALVPCGHVCCCHFCTRRLQECPVCRAVVEQCYALPDYLVRRLLKLPPREQDTTNTTITTTMNDSEEKEEAHSLTRPAQAGLQLHSATQLLTDVKQDDEEGESREVNVIAGQQSSQVMPSEAVRELPVHNDTATIATVTAQASNVLVDDESDDEEDEEYDDEEEEEVQASHRTRHIPGMSALLRVAQRALRRRPQHHSSARYVRVENSADNELPMSAVSPVMRETRGTAVRCGELRHEEEVEAEEEEMREV